MDSLKEVLMKRDGLTEKEAQEQIEDARKEFTKRLKKGEMLLNFCEEKFGLEPDYLEDLIGI